jgi:signal transduction histidine kinase
LFIARAIVSAHGGEIDVSSSAETGTTFTVALPKAQSARRD